MSKTDQTGLIASMKTKTRIAIALIAVMAIAAVAYLLPLGQWTLEFIGWIRGFGVFGAFIYGLFYAAGTVLLWPGTALTLGGGFLYGPFWGTLLVSPASVAGATMAFVLSRTFARGWIARKVQKYPRFAAIDRAVGKHSFKTVLLLRLQPVNLPFAVLNYALGLTSVNLSDYILASWLGMLPATILYVYIGSVVQDVASLLHGGFSGATSWQRLLFWGGLVATGIFVVFLTRLAKRALEEEIGESQAAANRKGQPGDDLNENTA
ncbi:MAG: TVP38/TMEM64 family protein [Acidobacteria bacterium]|nr:MAG: TVP38/TMEM64 family protein [Acidobacteriota bacterium]